MLFVSMTFWMLIIVFAAYAVLRLWSGLIAPKVINMLLFPGTFIAQIGHITGVLLTGGNMADVKKLIAVDTVGKPNDKGVTNEKHVLGAAIVALLPILACGITLYLMLMMSHTGGTLLAAAANRAASDTLPLSLSGFWEWVRHSIGLIEAVSWAILTTNYDRVETWVFVYLLLCLSVRMAPLPGTQRGAVLAILIIGGAASLGSLFTSIPQDTVLRLWGFGSFAVATLLLILIASLGLYGSIGLFRIITNR